MRFHTETSVSLDNEPGLLGVLLVWRLLQRKTKVIIQLDDQRDHQSERDHVGLEMCVFSVSVCLGAVKVFVPQFRSVTVFDLV